MVATDVASRGIGMITRPPSHFLPYLSFISPSDCVFAKICCHAHLALVSECITLSRLRSVSLIFSTQVLTCLLKRSAV